MTTKAFSTGQLVDAITNNGSGVSITGTANISGLTASSSVATDASKNLVSVTNTGSGNNVLATSPTLTTPVLGDATASSLNGGQLAGFRNRIINGDMRVAQRGAVTTAGGYTLDRWVQLSGNSIANTQEVDAPTGFKYSLKMVGTGSNISQRIESANVLDISGQTITVSFWYKNTSGSDNLSLLLYYANSADNFGALTQIGLTQVIASPSASWTKYSYTFSSISANATNGVAVYFLRGSGGASTGFLTGVQLEVGSVATPFEQRPIGTELALCQRYYEKSFDVGTAPAQAYGLSSGERCFTQTVGASAGTYCVHTTFAVTKRGTPTVTTYNPGAANAQIRNESAATDFSATAVENNSTTGFSVTGTTPGVSAVGNKCGFHWTASAEL